MIIAAVDDLLFSSRIRSTAKALGLEVIFARSLDAIVEQARARQPALVILDLNGDRMRPLEAVVTLKADPSLASVHTVGFVSHVQVDLIEAARAAGVDEVMARSAFSAHLPEILSGAR